MDQFNAEVFVAIAKLGSYSAAAEKLGYTTAGVRYIVNSMEENAGFRIFIREYGGMRLTPEGENILPFMQRILESQNTLLEQIDRINGLETGRSEAHV